VKAKTRKHWTRCSLAVGVTLVTLPIAVAAPLPPTWKFWRYSRAIELAPVDRTRLAGIALPQNVYPHAQKSLPDIRVIDDQGAEVPYARFAREGTTNTVARRASLKENSFAPGEYTQLVVDLGDKPLFHNAVEVQTRETDFIEWVNTAASDDGHEWRVVQERAPIFRFQKEHREGTQTVHYSENNARYLRIRILEGTTQFPVNGMRVVEEVVEAPERTPVTVAFAPDPSPKTGETAWRFDLGTPPLTIAEVRFSVTPSEFSRNVSIESSNDGSDWEVFINGEIYRFQQGDSVREQLVVRTPAYSTRRYWRVAILDGNDAPLTGVVPALYMTPLHIVFEQRSGRSYRLLYGQSEAKEPAYDLARRESAKQMETAIAGELGPEEINTDWADPRPWTEKHEIFLWIVLGMAVILLGYSAIRSLRRSAPPVM
jgi:Protein of unknown function (DUF3999)